MAPAIKLTVLDCVSTLADPRRESPGRHTPQWAPVEKLVDWKPSVLNWVSKKHGDP
jgi:hypothetical protein